MATEPFHTRPANTPADPTRAPEFTTLRELRRTLSRGGLPAQRTPEDEARLAAFAAVKELLRVVDEFRIRVRAGEDVHLRVLEHKSTPERMKVEIAIEQTGHQGSP
jgi:hypothetical protein